MAAKANSFQSPKSRFASPVRTRAHADTVWAKDPDVLKKASFSRGRKSMEKGWGGESDLRITSGKEFQASYQRMELSSTNKHTNASSFSPSYTAKDILRADLKSQNPPCGPPRLADGAV